MALMKFFLILLGGLSLGYGLKLPSYIKPCSVSNPNFNECATESANEAIPTIFKGDPQYHIPALTPLRFPEFKLDTNQLKFKMIDLDITANDMLKIKSIEVNTDDPEQITVKAEAFVPILTFNGTYKVDGQILLVPIVGSGHCKTSFHNMALTHYLQFKTVEKNGRDYLRITSSKCSIAPQKVTVNMDNLFNDKALSDNMNKFMNENWREILAEMQEPVNDMIAEIVEVIIGGIFEKVPQNKIILP